MTPELMQSIVSRQNPRDMASTVAILRGEGIYPQQYGTGTLFAIGDRRFLVTASHVVVPPRKGFETRLAIVGPTGTAPVPLLGSRIVTHSPGEADDDAADVALWDLEQSTIAGLGECTFLTQLDVVADDDFVEDYYFFSGFPIEWAKTGNEPDRGLRLMTYCTQLYRGAASGLGTYRPDWHVLLACGGGMDTSGNPTQLPERLNGISGCSIWRSYFTTQNGTGTAKVVAVQTGTFRNRTIVKGTRWAVVVKILLDSYPELKQPMSLTLPRHSD